MSDNQITVPKINIITVNINVPEAAHDSKEGFNRTLTNIRDVSNNIANLFDTYAEIINVNINI